MKAQRSLPGLPTMAALMLTAIIAAALGLFDPSGCSVLDGLQRWQTLLSASVTALGLWIAAWNVSRQIRFNILLREEDRLERQIPGLTDAANFLSGFVPLKLSTTLLGIPREFATEGYGKEGSTLSKDVETALPQTDAITRQRVDTLLYRARNWASHGESFYRVAEARAKSLGARDAWAEGHYDQAQAQIADNRRRFGECRDRFHQSIDEIHAEVLELKGRVRLGTDRLRSIRSQIESRLRER